MGASVTTEQKARNLERSLLSYSDLEVEKDLIIEDVKIDSGENYIHTIKCGLENKEILVMIHGYAGSSVFFYRMLSELAKTYQVYCIDLLGMGLSSRPQFNCESSEEAINFFVESIEKWRIEVNLEKFIMCGHSFGGHIAGHYTFKYTNNVSRLILFSPLGFSKRDTTFDLDDKEELKKLSFFQRQFRKLRNAFWKDKMVPAQLANKYGWLFGWLTRHWLTKRFRITKERGSVLVDFLFTIYQLPISSEKAIHNIINPNMVAFHPLEESIKDLEIPINVYFGDKDWMDDTGAVRIFNSEKKKNFHLVYVNDCGHQVTMENPSELLSLMFNMNEIEVACV